MAKRAGIFVDFENFYYDILNNYKDKLTKEPFDVAIQIIEEFKSNIIGQNIDILVGRAYGDWEQLSEVLSDLYFLFLNPNFSLCKRGKSSADIELSLDVLELMIDRSDINVFIILGGDRDYMPIVRRLREKGKEVIIAGLRNSISGDLRKNVGDGKCVDLDDLLKKYLVIEIPEKTGVSKEVAPVEAIQGDNKKEEIIPEIIAKDLQNDSISEEIKQEIEFSEEEITKCIELLLKARDRYTKFSRYSDFKILPFYKDFMNDGFPTMTNIERKNLVEKIQALGIIKTRTIQSYYGLPPTVVEIVDEHPSVQKVKEAISSSEPPNDNNLQNK